MEIPGSESGQVPVSGEESGFRSIDERRATLFSVLSVLWIFPTLGSLVILAYGFRRGLNTDTLARGLASIQFEQWVAFLLLGCHALFIHLARRYKRRAQS